VFVVSAGTIKGPATVQRTWADLPIASGLFVSSTMRISSVKFEILATTTAPGIVSTMLHSHSGAAKTESRQFMVGNSFPLKFILKMPKSTDFGVASSSNDFITVENQGGPVTVSLLSTVVIRTA